jgi:hypothetical protein
LTQKGKDTVKLLQQLKNNIQWKSQTQINTEKYVKDVKKCIRQSIGHQGSVKNAIKEIQYMVDIYGV